MERLSDMHVGTDWRYTVVVDHDATAETVELLVGPTMESVGETGTPSLKATASWDAYANGQTVGHLVFPHGDTLTLPCGTYYWTLRLVGSDILHLGHGVVEVVV